MFIGRIVLTLTLKPIFNNKNLNAEPKTQIKLVKTKPKPNRKMFFVLIPNHN